MHDQGVNMRVTANSNQGHRKYMEDCYKIRFHREEKQVTNNESNEQQQETNNNNNDTSADQSTDILFSYFGIFDGHGGKEAAQYAKKNLYWKIIESDDFWSDDDNRVLKAINDGFIKCHLDMWKYELSKWPKTSSGLPSTSGCTATVLFIKKTKAYVGHVGDSGLVIGFGDSYHTQWTGRKLTRDHKPEDPIELERIESCGGEVMSKGGVNRVVWNRPIVNSTASATNLRRQRQEQQQQDPSAQQTEKVPFLAVARSLGDLWSYNYEQDEFIVSPIPDVFTFEINPNIHRCIILATDGLWNVMRASETVEITRQTDIETENLILRAENNKGETPPFVNPSQRLVNIAIQRCCEKMLRADNTSCITIMLDKPGMSFSENVLQNGQQNKNALSNSDQTDGLSTPTTNMNKYNESFVFKSSKSLVSLRRRHWSGGTNLSEKQRSSKRLKNLNKSVTSTTIGGGSQATHIKKKLFNSSLTCNLERKHHKYDYNHNKTFANNAKDENENDIIAGDEDMDEDDIEKEEIKIASSKSFKITQTPKYKRRLRLIKERLLKTKNNLLNKKSSNNKKPTKSPSETTKKANNKHDQTLNQSLMFNFRHKFSLKRRTNDVCDEELQKSSKKSKLN